MRLSRGYRYCEEKFHSRDTTRPKGDVQYCARNTAMDRTIAWTGPGGYILDSSGNNPTYTDPTKSHSCLFAPDNPCNL